MKNISKIALALLAAVSIAPAAQAAGGKGDGKATILQPLTVTKTSDLDFGKIVASANPSSVSIDATGKRTCGGDLTCLGTTTAGGFEIAGYDGQTVKVSTDATATLTGPGGVNMETTIVPSETALTLTGGKASFAVSGTLSVAANQAAGVYSGSFNVTADYQ